MVKPPPVFFAEGTIVEVLSGARWYLVRTGIGDIECAAVSDGVTRVMGPKTIGIYSLGDPVLIAVLTAPNRDDTPIMREPGYILGSIPLDVATGQRKYRACDSIYQAAGGDAMNDTVHKHLADNFPKQFRDFNVSQPLDAIPGSDYGHINEMGVGYGISRLMAWIRASDVSGLYMFYQDNLTRLAAYNYEFWHSGGERWIKNDEGEINDVDMMTPYPWEAMGIDRPEFAPTAEPTDGGLYLPGKAKLLHEPIFDDQLILPRLMRLKGYLGDLDREMVILPAPTPEPPAEGEEASEFSEAFVERYGVEPVIKSTGLLDIHKHSTGMYTIRSAKGIMFSKQIYIPVPKQMQPPEQTDELGDGITNYAPAGHWGDADKEPHNKLDWDWSEQTRPDFWLSELFDYHAYMLNWFGVKPIFAHTKDWLLPEQGEFAGQEGVTGAFVPMRDKPTEEGEEESEEGEAPEQEAFALDDDFVYPLPNVTTIKIDHRVGSTRYYYSRSLIAQLPDGSIIIEDGYGSSIYMSGGNIYLSPPGDVWLKPGRSIIAWAPDDFIARAGSSCDITAAKGDVRIKADRNLHMLGGNSGTHGGVLIEGRASYQTGGDFKFGKDVLGEDVVSYGIILKSTTAKGLAAAPVQIYASDIYMKALSDAENNPDLNGQILLDADREIISSSIDNYRYVEEGITDIIGQKLVDTANGDIAPSSYVNRYSTETVSIGSKDLNFLVKGKNVDFDMGENVAIFTGRIGAKLGLVHLQPDLIDSTIEADSELYETYLNASLPAIAAGHHTTTYNEGIRGVAKFIETAGFTCRTPTQYGYENEDKIDLALAETRWQQMYRAKEIGKQWVEPDVEVPGGDETTQPTLPHPGFSKWVEAADAFVAYDGELWDWNELKDTDRGLAADVSTSPYTTVTPSTNQVLSTLKDGYLISNQLDPAVEIGGGE